MLAIGLMSGTSLDGVDACLTEIKDEQFKIVDFLFVPYTQNLKDKLLHIVQNKDVNIQTICSLNVELSYVYLDACLKLIDKAHIKKEDIEFVAVHGQTVWHEPHPKEGLFRSTLQLVDSSILASSLNTKIISGFRYMDMSVGGEGAPLVPFANYILFSSKDKNIALQNIGGISNVTYLKKNGKIDDIIAFDTGPGNMLIDEAMRKIYGKEYDDNGSTASKGRIIKQVLDELMADEYLKLKYPKSTGREKYNDDYLNKVINQIKSLGGSNEDIITTLSAYTADSILDAYKRFLPDVDKMIVSGGGAHNKYIIERLKNKANFEIEVNLDTDSLEAFSFSIIGYYTLNHLPANVPSVTGASRPVILGQILDPRIGVKDES